MILKCAHCGGINLHHRTVTVYARGEDSATVHVAQTSDRVTVVGTKLDKDLRPAPTRRDWLVVDLECETCGPDKLNKFRLLQNKGVTRIEYIGDINPLIAHMDFES